MQIGIAVIVRASRWHGVLGDMLRRMFLGIWETRLGTRLGRDWAGLGIEGPLKKRKWQVQFTPPEERVIERESLRQAKISI